MTENYLDQTVDQVKVEKCCSQGRLKKDDKRTEKVLSMVCWKQGEVILF